MVPLLQDLRRGRRTLLRHCGLAATVLLYLVLGIGVSTAASTLLEITVLALTRGVQQISPSHAVASTGAGQAYRDIAGEVYWNASVLLAPAVPPPPPRPDAAPHPTHSPAPLLRSPASVPRSPAPPTVIAGRIAPTRFHHI